MLTAPHRITRVFTIATASARLLPILLLIAGTAFLTGCKKDGGDTQAPVITVSAPTNHQSFKAGETVTVAAAIADNDEIHEVHLYVNNKATNAEILHFEDHIDSRNYTLTKTFSAQAGVTYTIEIEVTDHSGNEAKTQMEVSGNP